MASNERKVGPDLHTHQAAAADLNKTVVRKETEKIEGPGQGPGAYDARGKDK